MNAPRKLKRFAVLVSVGRHPVSGTARYSRNDAVALEIGRRLAERHLAQLDVIHAGEPGNPALAEYLALGAKEIVLLACDEGDDAVAALAGHLQGYDLVLTGTRAEGAFDTGMLPYRVAEALGYPLVGAAVDVSIDDGRVAVRQFLPRGTPACGDDVASRGGRAPTGERAAALRLRSAASGCGPSNAGRPWRRFTGGRMEDRPRRTQTRQACRRREAFRACPDAVGHHHRKPRRQRRN